MTLELHIKVVGALLLLLALAHFAFAKRFGWREELRQISLFSRQVFWVHCLFLMLTLAMFGLLSLCYTPMLLRRDPLATAVLAGFVVFWGLRLFVQFFVYDSKLWRGNRFNTAMHVLFSVMWTYYVTVYGVALWRQLAV